MTLAAPVGADARRLVRVPPQVEQCCRPAKILFLADHLGHPNGVFHGVTTYLLQVLPALQASGVQIGACFLRKRHPAAEHLEAHGIHPIFLSLAGYDARSLLRLHEIVRAERFTSIHATQMQSSLLARVLGRVRSVRVVLQIHDLTLPPRFARSLYRLLALSNERALCVSEAARSTAVDGYHVRPANVRVLYPGVDVERFQGISEQDRIRVRSELRVSDGAPLIAMIARFNPVKGHRAMLRIFSRVRRSSPACTLVFVGDGPEQEPCRQLAEQLGLAGHVRFIGHRSDAPAFACAADLIVIPSESEGLGLSAVEANLAGRPVVGFRIGGLPEVVRADVCGSLVDPGDEEGFAAAIAGWLERPKQIEEELARKRLAADRFGLSQHIERLREVHGA